MSSEAFHQVLNLLEEKLLFFQNSYYVARSIRIDKGIAVIVSDIVSVFISS